MRFYIGLGGIGCKALRYYAQQHDLPKGSCFYIDTDPATKQLLSGESVYLVQHLSCGTGTYRNIGRSAVLQEIYRGDMRDYFESLFCSKEVSLQILTSSFGGFGGGAAATIMDYLQANTWHKQKDICTVYALSESIMSGRGFPQLVMDRFESNTFDFIRDFSDRVNAVQTSLSLGFESEIFVSQCNLWLLDGQTIARPGNLSVTDALGRALDMSPGQLEEVDIKSRYHIKPASNSDARDVFISYSSKDQSIADLVVKEIETKGVRCWISSRDMGDGSFPRQIMQQIRSAKAFVILLSKHSIASEHVKNELDRAFSRLKDGLCIVPFLMEETSLDDECMYYLCRQEIFSATKPPIEDRIKELAAIVEGVIRPTA